MTSRHLNSFTFGGPSSTMSWAEMTWRDTILPFIYPGCVFNMFKRHFAMTLSSYLLSDKSVLFPTNIMITSLPRSVRTSSIHFDVCWKELASEIKKDTGQWERHTWLNCAFSVPKRGEKKSKIDLRNFNFSWCYAIHHWLQMLYLQIARNFCHRKWSWQFKGN